MSSKVHPGVDEGEHVIEASRKGRTGRRRPPEPPITNVMDICELEALIKRGELEALDAKFVKAVKSTKLFMYIQGVPMVVMFMASAFTMHILVNDDENGVDLPPFLPAAPRPLWGIGGNVFLSVVSAFFFCLGAMLVVVLVRVQELRGSALLMQKWIYLVVSFFMLLIIVTCAVGKGVACEAGQLAALVLWVELIIWMLYQARLELISPGLGLEALRQSRLEAYVLVIIGATCAVTEAIFWQSCGARRSFIFAAGAAIFFTLASLNRFEARKRRIQLAELVKADKDKYDKLWKKIKDEDQKEKGDMGRPLPPEEQGLTKLQDEVAHLKSTIEKFDCMAEMDPLDVKFGAEFEKEKDHPRRIAQEVALDLFKAWHAAGGGLKPRQRLDNLAVLFFQADRLNEIYQEQVGQWAQGIGTHHEAPVKRRARAIQKVHRSYHGNASKCLDLVRSGISFNKPAEVVECLRRIRQCDECAVLSVKNWFDPKFPAETGYRKVGLNLLLVNEATMRKGVERHVCELILSFNELDKHKSEGGGHDKYVKWRDAQVE
mmetsp:Transcript_6870/g.17843  ORF Transcript_6870/g.17843 Transcript_6870/m.17843 type:complete len:546 (-) Transcript_6870:625-2262(-)